MGKKDIKEICICSAVKTEDGCIFRGHRHNDCIRAIYDRKKKPLCRAEAQGFITSRNRFVSREEGCELQKSAGIKSVDKKNPYCGGELYSEDLY